MAVGTKGFDQFFSKRSICLISIIAPAMGFLQRRLLGISSFSFASAGNVIFFN